MKPEDPEEYIRHLEHGGGQPGAAPQPSGTSNGGHFGGQGRKTVLGETLRRRLQSVAKFANSPRGRVISVCAVASMFALVFFVNQHAGTTVHGNLIMINSGAKDRIDCNNGNVKLDGDNNTYTITGHCRRLEVSGSANHVAVDSADTISVLGDDNAVTYHAGAPTINKTGNNNIVTQRPSTR